LEHRERGPPAAIDFFLSIWYKTTGWMERGNMRAFIGLLLTVVFFSPLLALSPDAAEADAMEAREIVLPAAVGAWKSAGPPQGIDADNIFDYMDGGGELYLAYRFDHLLAYTYRAADDNDILVELYFMKSSDDAFGLLSLDWGGEAVEWEPRPATAKSDPAVPPARALYGVGLLRIWSGRLYARIMAFRDTPAAREAVLKLGEKIVAGRREEPPPAMLALLPRHLEPHWLLRRERTGYLRSHLVLNSLYYLSHENILDLDASCQAVFATYDRESESGALQRIHLLLVQYPGAERAAAALEGFIAAYLPEQGDRDDSRGAKDKQRFFRVEDGWLGCKANGSLLALLFACPDRASAEEVMKQVGLEVSLGGTHEEE
jgi:hypothetical protein